MKLALYMVMVLYSSPLTFLKTRSYYAPEAGFELNSFLPDFSNPEIIGLYHHTWWVFLYS